MFKWESFGTNSQQDHIIDTIFGLPIAFINWSKFYNISRYSYKFNISASRYLEEKVNENV